MSAQATAVSAQGRRVFRNTALLGAGNSVRLVVGFATTILITDQLGIQYGLLLGAQRYADFFRLIAMFGLNVLLVRGLAAGRDDPGELLGSVVALRLGLGVVFAAVTMGSTHASGYLPEHLWLLGIFVGVSLGLVAVETLTAFCEGFERMDRTAPLPVARSLLMLGGASLVVWQGGGLLGVALVFLGTQVLQTAFGLYLSRELLRRANLRPRLSRMWWLLRNGPQYMAIGLAYAALRTANVTILTRFSTIEETSMYGAALNFIDLLFLVPLLAQRAFLPVFSRDGRGAGEVGGHGIYSFSALLMPSAVGLALLAEGAVALYPSGEFHAAAPVLRVLTVGIALSAISSVCATYLTGRGRVAAILRAYAVAVPLQVGLCLAWVDEGGAVAVAWATVGAQAVLCAGMLLTAGQEGLRIPWGGVARHLGCAGVMALAIAPLADRMVALPVAVGVVVYALALLAVSPADSLERRLLALGRERLRERGDGR